MKFKPYSKYKPSGIEWLGEVPVHWKVISIKWLSPVLRGASPRPIDDAKYFDENGEYAWVRIADVSACSGKLIETPQRLSVLGSSLSVKIEPGELFISIAGTVGKPCISEIKACIHDGFVYFPSLKINPHFMYRIFEAGTCYGGLGKFGTQLNLNTDTIGSIRIALPPPDEIENAISFLDRETAKIDTLIAKQEKLIELLKEKRQAVISHAVTKGLDPNVPMKPSGVEWLGDVPEHWNVKRIKNVLSILTDYTANGSFASLAENVTYLDEGYSRLVRLTDLREDLDNDGIYVDEVAHKFLSKSELFGGEILIANVGAYAGYACMMPFSRGKATLGPNMYLMRFNEKVALNQFVLLCLISCYLQEQLKLASTSTAQPKLNKDDVKTCFIAVPPVAQQEEILTFVENEVSKIDRLIAKAEQAITLQNEHRTALISAAVTGKINVREAASELQEAA